MPEAIEFLKNYDIFSIILIVFFFFICIKEARELSLYFKKIISDKDKKENKEKELEEKINSNIQDVTILKKESKKLQDSIKIIENNVQLLLDESKTNKRTELKDRISQGYRYYSQRKISDTNPIPFWNEMEKETFEELIESYEKNGGVNSFVHTKVIPEMGSWELVDYITFQKLINKKC